jgi:hypothetical protein
MAELKNLKDNHSLVEDEAGNPYAFDHEKNKWHEADDETEFEIHPIDRNGFADFNAKIKAKKKNLTPKFVKLIPRDKID